MDRKGREGEFQCKLRNGSLCCNSLENNGKIPEGSLYSTSTVRFGLVKLLERLRCSYP